uniref:Uncharacterized protein n=2 Tax=Anopheles albimanus TaxID=7167 RepID=A0A182FKL1_ANOAL
MAVLPLGLVVDLTNTTRYYDPKEFLDGGVQYAKLQVVGKMVPKDGIVRRFMQIVDDFYRCRENQGKYVGVHCTHGLNRTGYLVCAYLIQKLRYRARDAIELFNARRGHEMERPQYLEKLSEMEGTSWEDLHPSPAHHDLRLSQESLRRHPHLPGPSSSAHRDRDWRNDSVSRSMGQRQPDWRGIPPPPLLRPFFQRPPNGEQLLSWRQRDPQPQPHPQPQPDRYDQEWPPLGSEPNRSWQHRRVGAARNSRAHPYSLRRPDPLRRWHPYRPAELESENVLRTVDKQ